MNLVKKTSLQNPDMDTKETLDWKLQQLTAKNIPMESGMADYIAFGMEGIDNDIAQLTNYKALIEAQIKQAKENQSKVKIECAEWLGAQGLDKIEGLKVSSITVTKAVECTTNQTFTTKFVDTFDTEEEYQNFLIGHGKGKFVREEHSKLIPAKPAQIKVNQKRK